MNIYVSFGATTTKDHSFTSGNVWPRDLYKLKSYLCHKDTSQIKKVLPLYKSESALDSPNVLIAKFIDSYLKVVRVAQKTEAETHTKSAAKDHVQEIIEKLNALSYFTAI